MLSNAVKSVLLLFLFIIVISYNKNTIARDSEFFPKTKYCYDNNLGWKFYCDEEISEKEKEEESDEKGQSKEISQHTSYLEQLSKLQKKVEEVKAKAVLEPTEQNVKEYMFLQQKIVNQASYFSDVWRRVLWATPELDYTQKRPVSSVGKNVWEEDRNKKMLDTLKNINKRYGIFFVYSTTCSFCKKYSQILYDFKNQYNIEIKGISIDNNFLPLWENSSFINKGHLEQLGIDYSIVPITVLFDNQTNSIIPVGYGLMTHDELMIRIYILTQTKIGEDY